MDIETRIRNNKKERQAQIRWRIIGLFLTILIIWFIISWAQVVHHGDLYYMTGEVKQYPWWNLFELIDKVKEVFK